MGKLAGKIAIFIGAARGIGLACAKRFIDEVASVAAFLASDDASYITAEIIYVDGGRLALNYTVSVKGDSLG
jgi:NAD(P)-dependent dehydrogenase (short-subunit alcohol dehydrogenase family)